LPGKSADEGREVLADHTGIVVVDGFAVYEVLARDGPGFNARALLGAHETEVRRDRHELADGLRRDRRADSGALRD
jgi:hypothetical protein